MSVYVVSAPSVMAFASAGDAAELVEPPQVEQPARRLADLAGDPDHHVGAAGDRRELVVGRGAREQRVGVGERGGALDRRLDRHAQAPRLWAAIAIASTIFV